MFNKWINNPQRENWEKDFENNEVVSVREWIAVVLLMVIPAVNIAMLFYWAFADKTTTSANKVNLARASLIVCGAVLAASALSVGFFFLGLYIHDS